MKKLIALIVFVSLSIYVCANPIYLKPANATDGFTIISDEVLQHIGGRLVIQCEISRMEANVVETPYGKFTLLSIPNFQGSNDAGNPYLPMMLQMIEVPFDAQLAVRVISSTATEYNLETLGIHDPLMPCQPSHRKDTKTFPFVYNPGAYEKDVYTEYPLVQIADLGVIRSYRIASLHVSPIAYNPVQKKIRVYNDISLEISLTGSNLEKTAQIKQTYFSPYFAWVKNTLMTPESLRSLEPQAINAPVCYTVVSDRIFSKELQPFIQAKIKKGFCVEVAYTDEIGKTKEQIQKYLHNLYNNPTPERPAPTFILFVGDYENIPAFSGTQGSYITDLYYGAVGTADILPDMLYGRFSSRTTDDVIAQVEKTLQYEEYRLPDPSFLKKTVLIAGWDYSHAVEWGYPQINYAIKYYFNQEHGYDGIHKFLTSGSHQNEQQIRELVSAGAGFVNYTAHGSETSWSDPTFTKSDIDRLMNTDRYPLVIGNCCLTNKFEVTTCFGEAWLRAKGKGAIGYIGGSSYTYWDEDLWWGDGFYPIAHPNPQGLAPDKSTTTDGAYDALFLNGYATNAAMMVAGNLAVQASNSPRKVYYWEVYHLMGDPALMIYLGIPSAIQVTHPQVIKIGTTLVDMEGEEGSYVGITMNGALYGAGIIDKSGKLSIPTKSFSETGNANITVSKQNRIPYVTTIPVTE